MEKEQRWNSPEIIAMLAAEPTAKRPRPSVPEMVMIRDLILMPHLLTMVQRNLDSLQYADMTLKPLYVGVTQLLMDQIGTDMRTVKHALAKRSIRLSGDPEYNEINYAYPYLCRGYDNTFYFARHVMGVQTRLILTEYLSKVYQETAGKLEN